MFKWEKSTYLIQIFGCLKKILLNIENIFFLMDHIQYKQEKLHVKSDVFDGQNSND